jgi:ectoine hydroxylase-related dioxygenase (phytanoyl-CoA dioxygenase family)
MFGFYSQQSDGNTVNGWHRDRYAQVPRGGYQNPVAITVLCYLQDMTEEFGPLRVIPGSHRTGLLIPDDERKRTHQEEKLVPLNAGDVIVFHSAMLHTGSPNMSGRERIFMGGQYNCTWMRHVDKHSGPTVQQLIREAKARNDHRTMRLFGVDEQLEERINSGFTAIRRHPMG